MTVSEFQSLYLSEQPFLWLGLAAALGVLVGVVVEAAVGKGVRVEVGGSGVGVGGGVHA